MKKMHQETIQPFEQISLFNALRQLLKSRGLTYRDLAIRLEVSEPTIKRLFQEQDCKLSRIMDICAILEIELAELMDISRQSKKQRGTVLSQNVEHYLVSHRNVGAFFMLLISHFNVKQIAELNGLSDTDIYQYLRELERLGLIELSINNEFKWLIEKPIRWRVDGPLNETLITINRSFIEEVIRQYKPNSYPFFSSSRLMTQESVEFMNEQIEQLYEQYQYRATLDQSFYPAEELVPYKLVMTLKSFDISRYFPVKPFIEK